MLERLVESADNNIHTRKLRIFFATIGTAVTGLFIVGIVFSIFSTNLAMGDPSIDLSRLVAPTVLPESAPPQPENRTADKTLEKPAESRLPQRVQNIQRIDEAPVKVPNSISTRPSKYRARPNQPFNISPSGDRDGAPGHVGNSSGRGRASNVEGSGFKIRSPIVDETDKKSVPGNQMTKPPELVAKNQAPPIKSLGVINGKAINLVIPVRSATAVSVNAKGQVRVNVLIGETGKVESASADSGHPFLKSSAVTAALRSTFKPTTLSNIPVKVRGIIIYNFN